MQVITPYCHDYDHITVFKLVRRVIKQRKTRMLSPRKQFAPETAVRTRLRDTFDLFQLCHEPDPSIAAETIGSCFTRLTIQRLHRRTRLPSQSASWLPYLA
jgi:hypothetical protein